MKVLSFALLLSFLCFNCINAQKIDAKKIIGNSIKVKNYKHPQFNTILNFEIAEHDFPNKMNWYEASAACAKLGPGWRLPTHSEMYILHKYIGYIILENYLNIKKALYLRKALPSYGDYWCDTVGVYKQNISGPVIGLNVDGTPIYSQDSIAKIRSQIAYYKNMDNGISEGWTEKSRICSVRAIKTLIKN